MVSVFAFYTDDPRSNPAVSVKFVIAKERKYKQKKAGVGLFFKQTTNFLINYLLISKLRVQNYMTDLHTFNNQPIKIAKRQECFAWPRRSFRTQCTDVQCQVPQAPKQFIFLKMGQSRPLFCLFSSFSHHNFNNTN